MPQHKRGPWSQTEDSTLLQLVHLHGAHNWVRISQTIGTRSPKQCRERFHQNLKPSLNHDPITPEEGVLIEQMVAEMGKRWAEIARRLRGRSDNAVKNWWNGGMNRRRRSNNRRTELEVRQQPHIAVQMNGMPLTTHQHPLPSNFPGQMPMHQQYLSQPMYHSHGHGNIPQPIRVPSNGLSYHQQRLIDTPLPSPSAFSQMSADGAPSLVSDNSGSTRSPNHGTSPIELPPLSGSRNDRRTSTAPMLQLGVPGAFPTDNDFQMSHAHMQRYDQKDSQPMLQEAFVPQQQQHHLYAQQAHYMHGHPRNPSPLQMQQVPAPNYTLASQPYQQPSAPHHAMPSSSAVQLPSISSLPTPTGEMQMEPSYGHMQRTPMQSHAAYGADESPKGKMSLSNLTH